MTLVTSSHTRYRVGGMDCASCAAKIDTALRRLPGVEDVAGYLSPNPGGVGPMTVALLMTNVVEAAERAAR